MREIRRIARGTGAARSARMRNTSRLISLVLLTLVAAVGACAGATPLGPPDAAPPPPTLREQLARPVELVVDPAASTGAVTASEREGSGWRPAHVALAVDAGSIGLASRGSGLVLHAFEVDVAPIRLPMLPNDAQLTDIAVRLAGPVTVGVTWQDDDDAIVLATLDLELDWSFSAAGGKLPLGHQHLPAVPLAITLHGEAGGATGAIALDQPGQLWSWADLLALADLSLQLPASTAPAGPP